MAANAVRVTLPGGYRQGDELRRVVEVRPLNGSDETFLLESAEPQLPVVRATELLARALVPEAALIEQHGDAQQAALELARALTVGDREALLLQLRALAFGDELACTLSCPDCARPLELALRVSDLLLSGYSEHADRFERIIESGGRAYHVRFRLPNGADQELAAEQTRRDPNAGAELILERCVLDLRAGDVPIAPAQLPPAAIDQLAAAIAEHDPQAELELDVTCAECGQTFTVLFDTMSFFLKELDARAQQLLRDVHALALHYHWSERDILALPARRRAHYLSLISESISATRTALHA